MRSIQRNIERLERRIATLNKSPDLHIEYADPNIDVYGSLSEFLTELGDQISNERSYLDDFENTKLIPLGSFVPVRYAGKIQKLWKRIEKQRENFKKDLLKLSELHRVVLLGLYMQMSNRTAKSTALRIDELSTRRRELNEYRERLEKLCLELCAVRTGLYERMQFIWKPHDAPEAPGVYILIQDGEVLYAGLSENLRQRLTNHHIVREYYRRNDAGEYTIHCVIVQTGSPRELESELLKALRPKLNKRGKE
jgi:predicted GIY-YIG superfamily endonuclease